VKDLEHYLIFEKCQSDLLC